MEHNTHCYHCGDNCRETTVMFDTKAFCCNGCKSVYEILNNNTLHQYYSLTNTPGVKPNKYNAEKYKFLLNEEIADSLYSFKEGSIRRIVLFLPEIHCTSCIWLLENLHSLHEGVATSEVNFIKKEAAITFDSEKINFQELASLLDKIGYPPKFDGNQKEKKNKITQKFYLQLGVAFFCFGNIMLFSFPEYMNIDASYYEFRTFFSYLIFGISLPLLLFSAKDYWLSAFKALRNSTLNLDVPITLGIIALYGRSVYDIFTDHGPGYMDSFAGFILFLLIGKWFQNKTYQALSFERDYKSYFPMSVTKIEGESESILPIDSIEIGDVVLVKNEEIIPADGILLKGNANIDYSFVTGESKTITKALGTDIFAGGKQIGEVIELKITKKVEQSYLTQLWNQKAFQKQTKKGLTELTDKLSKFFIVGVIIVAVITGIAWVFIDVNNVINIITAVLIVACPCALALSIPFTFGSAMRSAGRENLYLKNAETVEQLGKVTDIVFDKTGTITSNDVSNIVFEGNELSVEQMTIIASVSRNSSHPLSKMVYQTLKPLVNNTYMVEDYTEVPGQGISGVVKNKNVRIGSSNWVGGNSLKVLETRVFISVGDEILGFFVISNKYREEFTSIIYDLKKGYNVHLLSGDNESEKSNLLKYFSDKNQLLFNQKPIDKLNYIKQLQKKGKTVMMLGDGLNDAGALKQSNVGVVVSDDVYNFSPACDGIIDAQAMDKLPRFLQLGKFSIKTLRRSYVFSLAYNIIGLSFAVFGFLTPLVAAILMPLSSISVVIFASLSVRYFGR